MKLNKHGQIVLKDTNAIIQEINELIHKNLNKEWMAAEWVKRQTLSSPEKVHPLVNIAYAAHQQINDFIKNNTLEMTPEIFELAELAIKINLLRRHHIKGLQERLNKLISSDFTLYRTARYEIQIAGMLLQRGHEVEFIAECESRTPDILILNASGNCEVECKRKEPGLDQIDYIQSIYNNTQTARKQFSKKYPGIICIDIDKNRFDEYQAERDRLEKESIRAMRNSTSISAIFLTSKICLDEAGDYVYRHRVTGIASTNARFPMPEWLSKNIVSN